MSFFLAGVITVPCQRSLRTFAVPGAFRRFDRLRTRPGRRRAFSRSCSRRTPPPVGSAVPVGPRPGAGSRRPGPDRPGQAGGNAVRGVQVERGEVASNRAPYTVFDSSPVDSAPVDSARCIRLQPPSIQFVGRCRFGQMRSTVRWLRLFLSWAYFEIHKNAWQTDDRAAVERYLRLDVDAARHALVLDPDNAEVRRHLADIQIRLANLLWPPKSVDASGPSARSGMRN